MKLKKLFSAVLSLAVAFAVFAAPVNVHAANTIEKFTEFTIDWTAGTATITENDPNYIYFIVPFTEEIYINSMKPYYTEVTLGDKVIGKNIVDLNDITSANSATYKNDPRTVWSAQPTVNNNQCSVTGQNYLMAVKLSATPKTVNDPVDYVYAIHGFNIVELNPPAVVPSEPAPTETAPAASATHTHLWGYNTQYDAAAHWDHCHVCGAKNTPVAHSDADGDGVCVCGWFISTTPSRVNPNTGVTAEMLG